MGLGKTISCLAHICDTLNDAKTFIQSNDLSIRRGKDGNPVETVIPLKCTKATLIIAPLSTVSNWEEQLATHVKPGILSTYIYHGTNREGSIDKLAEYDCIVTTYSTLSQDFMGRPKTFSVIALHPGGMSPRPPPKVIDIKGYICGMLIIMWQLIRKRIAVPLQVAIT